MGVESNADEVAGRLKAFSTTRAIVGWLDSISPVVIEALKKEAPYGPDRGQPHLRDRIFSERHSSIGAAQGVFDTDRSPLADWIMGGTKPHDIPNAFGWGPNFGIGGRFNGKFHPGTKPNPFNVRAWVATESVVMDELVEALGGALDG